MAGIRLLCKQGCCESWQEDSFEMEWTNCAFAKDWWSEMGIPTVRVYCEAFCCPEQFGKEKQSVELPCSTMPTWFVASSTEGIFRVCLS